MIKGTIALSLSLAAVSCLYLSWRKRFQPRRRLMHAGWLLAITASGFWLARSGAEFGSVYAVLVLSLLGWLAVLHNAEIKQRRHRLTDHVRIGIPAPSSLVRNMALFLYAVPVSAIASTYISVAVLSRFPGSVVNVSVAILLLTPLLWGLAACWVCADTRRYRPAVWISLAGLIGAAMVHS